MSEKYDDVVILRIQGSTKKKLIEKANEDDKSLSSLIREILDRETNTERQEE